MTHYPTHERQAFLDWVESGFPSVAVVEENYERREISADDLLRRFLLPDGCTDCVPRMYCDSVADHVGADGDYRGMTYAIAASALIAERATDGAGAAYLSDLFAGE